MPSKKGQLNRYDIQSLLEHFIVYIAPTLATYTEEVQVMLDSAGIDPIYITLGSIVLGVLRKLLIDYSKKKR